jgi:hypothetical protein
MKNNKFVEIEDSGLFVSRDGLVKDMSGEIRTTNKARYTQLKWKSKSKKRTQYLHRAVYMAFVGKIPDGMEINHIDGNKANNRIENLEIVTKRENSHKARALGLMPRVTFKKLSENQVREIKQRLSRGEMARYIAPDYKVSEFTIADIKNGRSWSWLK